ncbi:hypothetical protein ABFX02_03G019000 [Erythranthe guttata]
MKLHFHGSILFAVLLLLRLRLTASAPPPFSCDASDPKTKTFGFCKANLPIDERVHDLITRLTIDEKISQLVNSAPAIPRLGISAYEWWSEALHGVSGYGLGVSFNGTIKGATSFPQVILSASTFDSNLWYRIGQAIGKEARAMYNQGQVKGMAFWAPNVNIFRDPRWGRGHETPGEDPLVAGKYAVAFVRGIQGDNYNNDKVEGQENNNSILQASACCKHFTAYDLDNWKGVSRLGFDAKVTKQDLADTYQPPFKSCIQEGRASGIMCAYNRVNGVPNCADYDLLTKTARGEWGFQGYIVSDCNAVAVIHDVHKYAKLPEDAVADVLKAVLVLYVGLFRNLKKMLESDIDRALHNLFSVQMRLGFFNGNPKTQPFGKIGPDQACTQEHQQLALKAAHNGIVLLKNSNNRLPLSKTSSLAVIGPNANNAYVLLGNYEGRPCKSVEVFRAIQSYAPNATYEGGCKDVNCAVADVASAVRMAKEADDVVLVMGLNYSLETEDHDRVDLVLPGQQEGLIRAVAAASKKPVVLVLICGGPVDVSFAKDDPKIGSILWVGYPGEAGGIALADILYGQHNPGGKLPVTWYPKDFIKIPMTDMRMRPDPSSGYPGRTYRFYNGPKVFEFGYGLSYTTHSYEFIPSTPNTLHLNQLTPTSQTTNETNSLSVSKIGANNCEKLKFSTHVGVKNTGNMPGKHPVLLFVRHERNSNITGRPLKQLVGFESVSLNVGESGEIEFVLDPCEHLSTANEDGDMVIEEGYRYLVVEDKEYSINIVL